VRINAEKIVSWIRQFNPKHFDIALRLLEAVDYYDPARIVEELASLVVTVEKVCEKSRDEIYFASFTPPGKSGDWMMSAFRLAADMKDDLFKTQYISLSALSDPRFKKWDTRLGPDAKIPAATVPTRPEGASYTFVFLDDYIGSGRTALDGWAAIQGETNDDDRYYLAALVATESGRSNVTKSTNVLKIVPHRIVYETDKAFHPANPTFNEAEKLILRGYCKRVSRKNPGGYRDTQSLTVFYQRCADNVLPILYRKTSKWEPLFPRNLPPPVQTR
jgi:hypothetical protein